MVSSLVFGEKNALIDTENEDLYRLNTAKENPAFLFLTLVLIVRTYLSYLGLGLALPNFATHFCQTCLKFSK